jgi:endopolyphosphatase
MQYYAPEIMSVRADEKPAFELEYTTFARKRLRGCAGVPDAPGEFCFPQGADAATALRRAPYGMPDLTVGSWLALARRLGNPREKALRNEFGRLMRLDEDWKS